MFLKITSKKKGSIFFINLEKIIKIGVEESGIEVDISSKIYFYKYEYFEIETFLSNSIPYEIDKSIKEEINKKELNQLINK